MAHADKYKLGILCCRITFDSVLKKIPCDVLEPVMVKGKEFPVEIFRPSALNEKNNEKKEEQEEKGEEQEEMELIITRNVAGRKEEKEILESGLSNVKQNQGGIILLEGVAGLGKTKLVSYLMSRSTMLNINVLTATADSIEKSTPFFVFRGILRSIYQIAEQQNEQPKQQILNCFSSSFNDTIPLLNELLPTLEIPETKISQELSQEQKYSYLCHLLVELFSKYASPKGKHKI